MKISYKRHIAKAISYRILGTTQTCLISFFMTGNWWVSGSIGLIEMGLKPLVYFIHERVWYKLSDYGVNKETNK